MRTIYALGTALLALSTVSAEAQTYYPPTTAPAPGYAAPAPYAGAPVYAAPAPAMPCQPYSDKFSLGGEVRVTQGTACMHPDGSWELHPNSAGMRYVMHGNGLFLVPSQPFAVIIGDDHHHHHHPY